MVMAVRTAAPAWNVQYEQPVRESSEYTPPVALPTNTRPPTTAGCANADVASGNPNAHRNFSLGTSAALRPAIAAGWKRALESSAPQPFQRGPEAGSNAGAFAGHWPAVA